jgi:methyl-accepting chemotaxis protein
MSSCNEISAQLAALAAAVAALDGKYATKAELSNYLNKNEKPAIIQQSVASAESLIIPAVIALITSRIAPLSGAILTLQAGLATLAPLAPLVGVVAGILSLLGMAGILATLGGRIDAVESLATVIGNDVSRALGLIGRVERIATGAQALAESAVKDVKDLASLVNILYAKLERLIYDSVGILGDRIDGVIAKVEDYHVATKEALSYVAGQVGILRANFETFKTKIQNEVDEVRVRVNEVRERVNEITKIVNEMYPVFILVKELLKENLLSIAALAKDVQEMANQARTALNKAISAESIAIRANNRIEAIQGKISAIEDEIAAIYSQLINQGQDIINNYNNVVNSVSSVTNNYNNFVSNAGNTITNIINNTINNTGSDSSGIIGDTRSRLATLEGGFANTRDRVGTLEGGLANTRDRVGTLEGGFANTRDRVGTLDGGLANTRDRVGTLEGGFANTRDRVGTLEGGLANTRDRVGTLDGGLANTRDRVGTLEGGLANTRDRVGTLEGGLANTRDRVGTLDGVIGKIRADIPAQVQQGIQTLAPPLVQTLVPPLVQTLVPPMVRDIVAAANSSISSVVNNLITNITNMNVDLSPVLQAIGRVDTKVETVQQFVGRIEQTTQETKKDVKTVNDKMGDKIPKGLSGWMLRFTGWAIVDRVINFLTFATTVHNAQQLSSNIFVTLISAMQNVINLFEIRDSEQNLYDLSSIIGTSLTNFNKAIIGEENYNNFVKEWAKYNRTYQAAGNLFSSLLNVGDTVAQALQVVSSQTGKIGNALRAWGVVSDKAYSWMNPNPNFSNPLLTKLTSLEETASMVENVSQQPLNVKSSVEEVVEARKELDASLEQKDGSKQGREFPEAKKEKEKRDGDKNESEGKEVDPSEKLEGE